MELEKVMQETKEKIDIIEKALLGYPNADLDLMETIRSMKVTYKDLEVKMWGDDAGPPEILELYQVFTDWVWSAINYIKIQLELPIPIEQIKILQKNKAKNCKLN